MAGIQNGRTSVVVETKAKAEAEEAEEAGFVVATAEKGFSNIVQIEYIEQIEHIVWSRPIRNECIGMHEVENEI